MTVKEMTDKLQEFPEDWLIMFQETGMPHTILALTITRNRKLYYSEPSKQGDYTVHDSDMTLHMAVKAPDEKSGDW